MTALTPRTSRHAFFRAWSFEGDILIIYRYRWCRDANDYHRQRGAQKRPCLPRHEAYHETQTVIDGWAAKGCFQRRLIAHFAPYATSTHTVTRVSDTHAAPSPMPYPSKPFDMDSKFYAHLFTTRPRRILFIVPIIIMPSMSRKGHVSSRRWKMAFYGRPRRQR